MNINEQLADLVVRHEWRSVARLLDADKQYSGGDTASVTFSDWMLEVAGTEADEKEVVDYILPFCTMTHRECILRQLVSRDMWSAVSKVINMGVSDSQRNWAIEEASKRAGTRCFQAHFVPFCTPSEAARYGSDEAVSHDPWEDQSKYFKQEVCAIHRTWRSEQIVKELTQTLEHADCNWVMTDDSIQKPPVARLKHGPLESFDAEQDNLHIEDMESLISLLEDLEKNYGLKPQGQSSCRPCCEERKLPNQSPYTQRLGKNQSNGNQPLGETVIENPFLRAPSAQQGQPHSTTIQYTASLPEDMSTNINDLFKIALQWGSWKQVENILLHDKMQKTEARWEQSSFLDEDVMYENTRSNDVSKPQTIYDPFAHNAFEIYRRNEDHFVDNSIKENVSGEKSEQCIRRSQSLSYDVSTIQTFSDPFDLFIDNGIERQIYPNNEDQFMDNLSKDNSTFDVLQSETSESKLSSDDTYSDLSTDEENEGDSCENGYDSEDGDLGGFFAEIHQEILNPTPLEGMWNTIGKKIIRGKLSNEQLLRAIRKAMTSEDSDSFARILILCTDDQLDFVFAELPQKKIPWASFVVRFILKRHLTCDEFDMGMQQLINESREQTFIQNMIPLCPQQHFELVFDKIMKRGWWKAARHMLRKGDGSVKLLNCFICQGCIEAGEMHIIKYILPMCKREHIDDILTKCVERCLWKVVGNVLNRSVSTEKQVWAVDIASKRADDDDFCEYILSHCRNSQLEAVLKELASRGLWKSTENLLHTRAIDDSLRSWITEQRSRRDKELAWKGSAQGSYTPSEESCFGEDLERARTSLLNSKQPEWSGMLSALVNNLVEDLTEKKYLDQHKLLVEKAEKSDLRALHLDLLTYICCSETFSIDEVYSHMFGEAKLCCTDMNFFTEIILFEKLISAYQTVRQSQSNDERLVFVLSVLPLFPNVQSIALRLMLLESKWKIIQKANIVHVWEQVRRELFKAAVEQRKWSIVKQWADHTLYDDMRGWALGEVFREKRWDVFMLLADYGLTKSELMLVHYRLAKYADVKTLRRLLERGGNLSEMGDLLQGNIDKQKTKEDREKMLRRCVSLKLLEKKYKAAGKYFKMALQKCHWRVVLYELLQRPDEESIHLALDAAIEKEAWHVVFTIGRLWTVKAQRNNLFPVIIRCNQWGVCRLLLELGVSVEMCRDALPELMENRQWLLVARVMEYNMDDTLRWKVLQFALQKREGSIVWHCIRTMQKPLSAEERKILFDQAYKCEMWQAVKPLVEEKDNTGIVHRDKTMSTAIVCHQWDVVDYCQMFHGDIDIINRDGHSPLLLAASDEDWEAVRELVGRDADPSKFDPEKGTTALHLAIAAGEWETVKTLIQFHANINQTSEKQTQLGMLINRRKAKLIDETLFWGQSVSQGMNLKGETPLHAVCIAGKEGIMYYLIARRVDPLACTASGKSVLMYAVQNKKFRLKMVAECIKLGMSTEQPTITQKAIDKLIGDGKIERAAVSPFSFACLAALSSANSLALKIAKMLYESGACHPKDLYELQQTVYLKFLEFCHEVLDTDEFDALASVDKDAVMAAITGILTSDFNRPDAEKAISWIEGCIYLFDISNTPRSLMSTCRLVISHHLNRRWKRHIDVHNIPLPPSMKRYVMFTDLTSINSAGANPTQNDKSSTNSGNDSDDDEDDDQTDDEDGRDDDGDDEDDFEVDDADVSDVESVVDDNF